MHALTQIYPLALPRAPPASGLSRFQLPAFAMHHPGTEQRAAVEQYISARFAQAYQATLSHFLPMLLSLGSHNRYCAAVGLANAADGPLFAESYLDQPIEALIGTATGTTVRRDQILEIGNLVSTWKGSGMLLFVLLSELIERLGFPWVIFTATPEVERLLAKLHYAPVVLADALPSRSPDGGAQWGSYYDRRPRVMFGDVHPAVIAARKGLMYRSVVRAIDEQVNALCAQFRQFPGAAAAI